MESYIVTFKFFDGFGKLAGESHVGINIDIQTVMAHGFVDAFEQEAILAAKDLNKNARTVVITAVFKL